MSVLAQIFVGWPAVIVSLILLVVGNIKKRFVWALVGAVLSIPFSLNLAAMPKLTYAILLPLFTFGSAYMIRRGNQRLAWLLMVPFALIVVWVGALVVLEG